MVSKKYLDIGEKQIKDKAKIDNDYIAKQFVKDKRDFDKGLAKAIVKRGNQQIDDNTQLTEEEFKKFLNKEGKKYDINKKRN